MQEMMMNERARASAIVGAVGIAAVLVLWLFAIRWGGVW